MQYNMFYALKTSNGYRHLLDVIQREITNMRILSLEQRSDVRSSSRRHVVGIGDPQVTREKEDQKKRTKEKHVHN